MAATMLPAPDTAPAARPLPERRAGPLQALDAVLQGGVESVRNTGALYLLLLTLTLAGLLLSPLQHALVAESWSGAAAWGALLVLVLLLGSTAAGLVLMDEALGRECRLPLQALRAAPRAALRLLAVVLGVVLAVAALAAAVTALLAVAKLPSIGPALLGLLVPLAVPLLGLAGLVLLTLVGPIAAPAAWFGLSVGQTWTMLVRQLRQRLVHAVLLSAAVSLLSALTAALVSAVVLAGGRALAALAVGVVGLPLAPQPFLAALFGQALRVAPGAPALPEHTAAAITGAGLVFALGLVLPGLVYLRGLCELFLALRRADGETAGQPGGETDAPPGAAPETPR